MRTDHAFRIGSVTKTFTGIVIAQLHTEGKLDTDAVMTNYLPASITSHIPNADRITLRQMTRHTSGIYDFNDSVASCSDAGCAAGAVIGRHCAT